VESINSWISGICKDYPGIIPLVAIHPEHPDPEAEILWMRQPGIKGIKLRSPAVPPPDYKSKVSMAGRSSYGVNCKHKWGRI